MEVPDPPSNPTVKDLNYTGDEERVRVVLNTLLHSKQRDSIANQMYATDLFERTFNIRSPGTQSPITLVTHNASMDYLDNDVYEKTVAKLLQLKAPEATGLSLDELLEKPRHELLIIIRSLLRNNIDEQKRTAAAMADANREGVKDGKKANKKVQLPNFHF